MTILLSVHRQVSLIVYINHQEFSTAPAICVGARMSVAPYCSIFKIMSLKLFLFLTVVGLVAAQGPNPTLRVAHGLLQGAWKVSTKGRSYASFQGVPYARPPIGKYRFRVSLFYLKALLHYF